MSRIEAWDSSKQCSMGIRLMIIELRKYNEIRELLIRNRTTGSQAQVSYWDEVRRASVTRAAVCMEVEQMGMQAGYRNAYKQLPSRDQEQVCVLALRSIQKSISTPEDKNRSKEKGVGTLRSQGRQLSSLPMRWRVVMHLSRDAHVIPGSGHVAQDRWDEFRLAVSWECPVRSRKVLGIGSGLVRADQCGGCRRTQ